MTVKELIKQLLDEDQNDEVFVQTAHYQHGIMPRYWAQPLDGIIMHQKHIKDAVVLVAEKDFWDKSQNPIMTRDEEIRLEELEYASKSGDRTNYDEDEIQFLAKLLRKAIKA